MPLASTSKGCHSSGLVARCNGADGCRRIGAKRAETADVQWEQPAAELAGMMAPVAQQWARPQDGTPMQAKGSDSGRGHNCMVPGRVPG